MNQKIYFIFGIVAVLAVLYGLFLKKANENLKFELDVANEKIENLNFQIEMSVKAINELSENSYEKELINKNINGAKRKIIYENNKNFGIDSANFVLERLRERNSDKK